MKIKPILITILTLVITACEPIIQVGESTGDFAPLSVWAEWSIAWVLPGAFLYCLFIMEKNATSTIGETAYGSGNEGQTYEYPIKSKTTRKGKPLFAMASLFSWLLFYPLIYQYWPIFREAYLYDLTGITGLDWFILRIMIPVLLLLISIVLSVVIAKSQHQIAYFLRICIFSALGIAVLNLGVWGGLVLFN